MRILFVSPRCSTGEGGFALNAQRLAARGHRSTVLTSRHSRSQPAREVCNGVTVIRVPIVARIGNGILMPAYPRYAWRMVADHDAVVLGTPAARLESAAVAAAARRHRRPVIRISQDDSARPERLESLLAEAASRVTGGPDCHRAEFARHLRHSPPFLALVRSAETVLIRRAGGLEPPLLDLGCGDGLFADLTIDGEVDTGVDPSPRALRRARARGRHRNLILAGASSLPCPDSKFRTVLSNSVLEHIPDLDDSLREVFRVLQPGGRFLITTPSHRFGDMLLGCSLLRRVHPRLGHAYADWFARHSRHYHTDAPDTWIERLTKHGFEVRRWQYYLSPQAHRALDAAHYLSLPRGLSRALTGRWVSVPSPIADALYRRWLGPLVCTESASEGPYLFIDANKPGKP
jgi:ubiquinone/menaquinone biosynthesis C-methylase UbiE